MPENREQLVNKINMVLDQKVTVDLIKKAALGLLHRAKKVVEARGMHQMDE